MNSLSPGLIVSEGGHESGVIGSDVEKYVVRHTPLGRIGQPRGIASIAALLASDESAWVSGQVIRAAGGFRALSEKARPL